MDEDHLHDSSEDDAKTLQSEHLQMLRWRFLYMLRKAGTFCVIESNDVTSDAIDDVQTEYIDLNLKDTFVDVED